MKFQQVTLENCDNLTGTVVVIDVLRAFSTAAYAFHAGISQIALVSTVESAFTLRERTPGVILMGEDRGLPIDGFDYGNSPSSFVSANLVGKKAIQRTSAGTQGVVKSRSADVLLASSLCCVTATAKYIQTLAPETVAFVITGFHSQDRGEEDRACADTLQSLLEGRQIDQRAVVKRVQNSAAARKFLDPGWPEFPRSDLEYALAIDRFNFAMRVERQEGGLWMRPVFSEG